MKLQRGDIILCVSNHWMGSIILYFMKFFQKDPVHYSHVAMVTNDTNIIQARLKVEEVLFDLSKLKSFKILRYKNASENQLDYLVYVTRKLLNNNYGYVRFLCHFFDEMLRINFFTTINKCEKEQICSSLVAWAYYKVFGMKFNNLEWTQVDPDDFEDHYLNNINDWEIISIDNQEV